MKTGNPVPGFPVYKYNVVDTDIKNISGVSSVGTALASDSVDPLFDTNI